MKRLLLCVILILAMAGCGTEEEAGVSDDLVKVGDTVITGRQLHEYMLLFAHSQGTSLEDATDAANYSYVEEVVLENMISNELMRQYLESCSIAIMTEERNAQLLEYKEELQTSDKIAEYLEEEAISEVGMEYAFIAPYYSTLFYDAVAEELSLSEADRRAYYEQHLEEMKRSMVTASHILVVDEALAREIIAELKEGADFRALAKTYSEDSATKELGGELGSFGKNETIPEFERAVFSMEPGKISDPVLSSYGYHIIRLEEKYEELLPFETVEDFIQDLLVKEACNEKLKQLEGERVTYLTEGVVK